MVSSPWGGIMYRSEGTSEAQAVVFLSIDGTSELSLCWCVDVTTWFISPKKKSMHSDGIMWRARSRTENDAAVMKDMQGGTGRGENT